MTTSTPKVFNSEKGGWDEKTPGLIQGPPGDQGEQGEQGEPGAGTPAGIDSSILPGVRSHWRCLDSDLGTTTLTDLYGHHDGIAAASIVSRGRPFYSLEEHNWIWQDIELTETSPIDAISLYDVVLSSHYWLGWVHCVTGANNRVWAYAAKSGSDSDPANNFITDVLITNDELGSFWESGNGVNRGATAGPIVRGKRLVYLQWERNDPSPGYTTLYSGIDGVFLPPVSGVISPSGGTNGVGFFSYPDVPGMGFSDAVLALQAQLTEAQFQAVFARGNGAY